MLLDSRDLHDGSTIEADICIVGAGVAGLVLAHACAERGRDVVLLESGGLGVDPDAQRLNDGAVIGDPYAGLRATRHRQVGGAARLWNTPVRGAAGAKFLPLDPYDFQDWPLAPDELTPWYRLAMGQCGLGRWAWDGIDWATTDRPVLDVPEDRLVSCIYQCGEAARFTEAYPRLLEKAKGVRMVAGATVVSIAHAHGTVQGLQAVTPGGASVACRTRCVVLAAGAIENARLLLQAGLGGRSVGRGFMEHPRDYSLVLSPRSAAFFTAARFYDMHAAPKGTTICGRLAVADKARVRHSLPSASITLLPVPRPVPGLVRAWRRLSRTPMPTGGYGWSQWADAGRTFEGCRVVVNLEQRRHPDNRIVLAGSTDRHGIPRAELHWRWRSEEQAGLERLRVFLADTFAEAGLGEMHITRDAPPDPNAHHHAGTTRMHINPAEGVVDVNSRVHGTENLFVAGASVFPSAGYANPTLTIAAFALRLSDHLAPHQPSQSISGR